MLKHTPKSARTRQFIIEKTADLFNTKGYAGTSMSDLTAATGLTKGSIYGNFENKESVAVAVFAYNLNKVEQAVKRYAAGAESSRAVLMAYVAAYRNFIGGEFPGGGCPVLNTATEADDTSPRLRELAAAAIGRWQQQLEAVVEKGKAAGEFRADCDAVQTALSVIALIEGGVMIGKLTNSQQHLDRVLLTVEWLIDNLQRP
ncbi:TetR/AcrR family transcriptional regulator [Pedobacter yulinensis]|uniref:TetR/AcrR family transcriptional regulator n=1 Tax=Pedobacter yulinensis TaxID=2126353 RepID=A0A2T3HNY2_9SPHI|nr:TetR/AcrR family transcriptional regulator [Pedobacter yulinensis]PST84136.1 TetR/AcrR family transcriptional regulator [Pedobacter yulinensis]